MNDKVALAVSRGVSKWRDYYVTRGRAEGRPRIQCGGEKKETERRYISDYMKNCSVCKGLIYPGDWIFWDAETKKSRHASSGHQNPCPAVVGE